MPEPQIALKVALLGPAAAKDTFARTVSNGWGSADTGGIWAVSGGAFADFAVSGGTGRHSHSTINVLRATTLPGPLLDVEQLVDVYPAASATGASVVAGMVARQVAGSYYWLRVEFDVGGAVTVKATRAQGGFTDLGVVSGIPGLTYTAGVPMRARSQVVGDRIRIKVWPASGVEPVAWHIDVADPAPLTAAGEYGLRTWVVGGNTNALPVVVHVDNYQVTPYWTDLAGRLHYGDGGGPLTIDIGRQTELQDVEPTRIAAALKNNDGWLNPRNPVSPYYGTWEQGRQVRVTETVAGEEIDLATGYLEIPDVQVNSPNLDQPCSITAVDRLGRLAGAPAFAGTLAEHVRAYGGPMALHYPLDDTYPHMSSNTLSTLNRLVVGFTSAVATVEPADLIQANSTAGPPGDDQSYARWQSLSDGSSFVARAQLEAPVTVTVGAADTVTVSAWVYAEQDSNGYDYSGSIFRLLNGSPYGFILGDYVFNGSLMASWRTPGGDTDLPLGRRLEKDVWRLLTVRYNASSGLLELWSGADGAVSMTAPASGALTLTKISVGDLWLGSIGHVQVRVGPAAATMTRQMHLDQYAHGYRGLHRQTVAERIATLAGYAGVDASDLDLPADAATPMQAAKLGGTNPAAAMQDAATTGQDTLMTTPQGLITLVPRGRRYNQPLALAIPFGWLSRGGIRYRPDKPVTDTMASIAGGGTARRIDEAGRARYGVLGRTVTLDSAIDADAGNWAAWTLAAFGQPRTRCPLLRINLLDRTVVDRKALLRLKVGDRIQLTGMPAGSPEDVPHLIVQGIRHIIGPHRRRLLELNTSPLLGPAPGQPPACPVVGDLVSNTAIIAY